ncbi:MAG: hypothetical protein Q7J67_00565 [bacterium]|nr:hypothetical protein [bacterium]
MAEAVGKDNTMIFPKTIKIGAHTYQVKHPYIFSNDTLTGQCCLEVGEIRIKAMTPAGEIQTNTAQLVCFFHEILHAINYTNCMENLGKECDPEKLIDALAEGMVQVLIDNDLYKKPVEKVKK